MANLKLDKSCKTCEFNFSGNCAGAEYGKEITDLKTQRECWSMSLDYSIKLANKLPENDQLIYEMDPDLTANDLLIRIETGEWKFKHKRKRMIRKPNGETFTY